MKYATEKERRMAATRAAHSLAEKLCPGAAFIVVSAGHDDTPKELDMTTVSSVHPQQAIKLLQHAIRDLRTGDVEEEPRT